jgi:hypothetical protein
MDGRYPLGRVYPEVINGCRPNGFLSDDRSSRTLAWHAVL